MHLHSGSYPHLVESMKGTDQLINDAIGWAKNQGIVQSGELVVTTSGHIEAMSGSTNILRVCLVP